MPPASECLTSINFDLVPHKPPPGVKLYDEEVEEIEESESEEEEDEDEDMEPTAITQSSLTGGGSSSTMAVDVAVRDDAPFPISAIATPADIHMIGSAGPIQVSYEGSDVAEEDEGLFAGGDDEEEESDGMEEVQAVSGSVQSKTSNGAERMLVEEEDYD